MSEITILGAGRVGGNLAAALHDAGHNVTVATRSGRQPDVWAGPTVAFASTRDAFKTAWIAINALPGDAAVAALSPFADALAGKVLVDVANAVSRGQDGRPGGLTYPGSSLAEELQAALPRTRLVKTLNTMLFPVMTKPELVVGANAFLSGNDEDAKQQVRMLLTDLGWSAGAIQDLGGVESARAAEAFILLVPALLKTYGKKPFAMAIAR